MPGHSIIWFRRDLRLADHPALLAALDAGEVLPLFVLDPAFDSVGAVRRTALAEAVGALATDLTEVHGARLHVVRGDPVDVVPRVAAAVDASTVHVSRDYTPYGRRRDEAVADRLAHDDRRLVGVGTPYAVQPGGVRKADGTPYAVFTPFARMWRSVGWEPPYLPPGADARWLAGDLGSLDPALDVHDPTALEHPSSSASLAPIGERAAHARLERFCVGDAADGSNRTPLAAYADLRDRPALAGTSSLSVDLKWGTLHPRTVLAELDASGSGPAGDTVFSAELAWREFYADVLLTRPETAWRNLDARMNAMPVDTDAAARRRFERWCRGETGFGIVDAGMRQLSATGWMHNRVRMITASFLVKDLHLPWQWGARWFLGHLVDGDLASNNHGWQWVAGSGTDAAPYFRVFNPTTQAERYDPDGSYVAHWVDESVAPMVDHAAERKEALRRLDVVKARS